MIDPTEVLQALDARDDQADWAVIVTTDHGHVDGGGHGGRSPEECAVWVVCDSAEVLSWITGPDEIAGAIERVYLQFAG